MKKNLPTDEIENQLAGSVFFRKEKPKELLVTRPTSNQEKKQTSKSVHKKPSQHAPVGAPPSKGEELNIKEKGRTDTPHERTAQPNGETERSSVVTELEEGIRESKRPTERYSFEIFTDMKEKIEDIQYRYKKKTGKKLSASRMIRE